MQQISELDAKPKLKSEIPKMLNTEQPKHAKQAPNWSSSQHKPECNLHYDPPERDDNSKLELVPTQTRMQSPLRSTGTGWQLQNTKFKQNSELQNSKSQWK